MQNSSNEMDISSRPQAAGTNVAQFTGTNIKTLDATRFSKFINWCLYGLVLILPLFFLSITSEIREFNKQTLLFAVAVVMLGAWVIKVLTTRNVSWVKTTLDYVVLGYLGIYLLASFLSIDKISSFLGYYGRFTGSFVSVICFVVLYYVVVNNVRNVKATEKLTSAFLIGGGIALIYGLLQILNVYVLRFAFAKSASFNTIGTLTALSIFAVLYMIFVQWSWLTTENISKLRHALYTVMTLVGLTLLFLINSFISWFVLSLGLIVFLALALVISNKTDSASWFWKPLLVLVVGVLFVGFQFLPQSLNPRRLVNHGVPLEAQLSNSTNWNMVKNALSSKPILGYGPGATGIAFGEIKPLSINKSIVWRLNFDSSSSEITNIAIETGILGLLAFEATAVLFLLYALFFLLKRANHPGRMHAFGFFVVWLTLYVVHFVYSYNTTFHFLFWFTLAMFMAITHWRESTESEQSNASFSNSPRSALSWMFASLIVLAVLLVGGFFQASVYMAEVAYANGVKELSKQQPNFAASASSFATAIQRNQYRDVYYLAYGQNLFFLASQEAAKDQPDVRKFQTWISGLVQAGNSATVVSPNKSGNWSARAQFYTQLRPLAISGSDQAIITSWEEAIKRDSKNPILQVRLALAYVNAAESIDPQIVGTGADSDNDGLSDARETELNSNSKSSDSNANGVSDGDEVKAGFNPAGAGRLTATQLQKYIKTDENMLRKAEESLKKSLELKDNLADSYITLARLYEKWGKLDAARSQLDTASKKFPANSAEGIDIRYELGRIMFNQRNGVEAEKIFNDIVKLVPNHANAHYSLGLVALQKNDRAKALAEFEKTREIVGPNVDLEKTINDLKEQLSTPPSK